MIDIAGILCEREFLPHRPIGGRECVGQETSLRTAAHSSDR